MKRMRSWWLAAAGLRGPWRQLFCFRSVFCSRSSTAWPRRNFPSMAQSWIWRKR